MTKKKDKLVTIKIDTGRPKEDISSLPVGWQDHILTMYKAGAADCEIKAEIYCWRGSFSESLWYRWMEEEEEFREVIEMGRILSEAYFSKVGREGMKNPAFNAAMYIWQTRNRYGWGEKGPSKEIPQSTSEIDYTELSTSALKELIAAKRNENTKGKS